jgi:hypothetical protein
MCFRSNIASDDGLEYLSSHFIYFYVLEKCINIIYKTASKMPLLNREIEEKRK